MSKLVFAGIIFLLGIIVSRVMKRTRNEDLSFVSGLSFWAGFLIAGGVILFSTFRVVPAGHVGIVSVMGDVRETPLSPGFSMVNPIAEVTEMSTQIQKHTAKYDSSSKDLQKVHVEMTLNFFLIPSKAPSVFKDIGVDYVQTIIDGTAASEVLKAETAQHNAAEILQKRPIVKSNTQENLTKWLQKYGIQLTEISLADVNFDRDYTQAIEAKQVQEQKAEQKRYEILGAQRDAEIRAAKAKGEADAVREEAKGRADALQIEGAAQAEYNKKIAESMSPMLLSREYLKKWDGNLPRYMFGDSKVMPLFQVPQDK